MRVFLLEELFFCLATRLAICLVVASAIPEIERNTFLHCGVDTDKKWSLETVINFLD